MSEQTFREDAITASACADLLEPIRLRHPEGPVHLAVRLLRDAVEEFRREAVRLAAGTAPPPEVESSER